MATYDGGRLEERRGDTSTADTSVAHLGDGGRASGESADTSTADTSVADLGDGGIHEVGEPADTLTADTSVADLGDGGIHEHRTTTEVFYYPVEYETEGALFGDASLRVTGWTQDHRLRPRLTAFGSIRYVEPPRAHLDATSTLEVGEPVIGRSGGSTASVNVVAEGVGTKVLAGSMARVLVNALGEGVRVQPYNTHPNVRGEVGYFPSALAALAARRLNTPEPDDVVPRPTITRLTWSSDAPISRPAAAPSEPQVDLGGFAFGPTGIMVPVVDEDVEAMVVPTHEGA